MSQFVQGRMLYVRRGILGLVCISAVVLLQSCGSNKKQDREFRESACVCGTYFKIQQRPHWADTEGLKNGVYYSQGIGECTGVKSIDVGESATNARSNLSRMLESQVRSEVVVVREGNTAVRSGSESGRTMTSIASASLLKNSSVYAHWVDPDSCTIYSAVKLAKADVDRTIQQAKAKEQSKLKNQTFMLVTGGEYADHLQISLVKTMNQSGVSRITDSRDVADYIVRAELRTIDVFEDKKLVRVVVFVSIAERDDRKVVWSQQFSGKSVSLSSFNRDFQIRQAMNDAFENDSDNKALRSALEKSTQ